MRQGFDREREVYQERIQKLEKELAAEKELRLSGFATSVSAVPGSGTGGAPNRGAGGGELSSVSVKKPVGKRASVVSVSERESAGSVETGVTREATAIPSTKPTLLQNCLVGLLMVPVVALVIRFLIVRVEHLPLWVVIV